MKTDDLSDLEILDENSIVQTLRCRFNKDIFYVSIPLWRNICFLDYVEVNINVIEFSVYCTRV